MRDLAPPDSDTPGSADLRIGAPDSALSIAVVSINYDPEPTGISVYSTGMSEYLARRGHRVITYTGFPYYPVWNKRVEDRGRIYAREEIRGVRVQRCYLYVPRRPSALRRIFHELSFVISSTLAYALGPRAALTIVVGPPLLSGFAIACVARMRGSRCVFHVQDLQPDAAIDLGMLKPGAITRALFWIERSTYAMVDRVSTISNAMRARIEAKGISPAKTMLFRNWANLDLIAPMDKRESLTREWGLAGRFIVLYSGNMGVKQGLDGVIEAAYRLAGDDDIVFLIVGDGGEKASLVDRCKALGLRNVVFRPSVAREELSRLLACADISIIPQKPGVADIVLPSKFGNILTSARPVLVAAEAPSELAQMVLAADCGRVVTPGDIDELVRAILDMRNEPVRRQEMANNGVRFAQEALGEDSILDAFFAELLDGLRLKAAPTQSRSVVGSVTGGVPTRES